MTMQLCADGPVRQQDGHQWLRSQGRSGIPSLEGHRTAGEEGGVGSISKLCNNKRWSLGPEWSMSEVGTSPPHDLDIPHGPVASKTHTY